MKEDKDFDCSEDKIVIQSVDAVAVYTNRTHDIIIRQLNSLGDDAIVIIPRDRVPDMIRALKRTTRKNKPRLRL